MATPDRLGAKRETPESQACVGLSPADAREAADKAGVGMVRIIDGPNDVIRFDFRPYRLNLLVVDGMVSRAAFFRGSGLSRYAWRVRQFGWIRGLLAAQFPIGGQIETLGPTAWQGS